MRSWAVLTLLSACAPSPKPEPAAPAPSPLAPAPVAPAPAAAPAEERRCAGVPRRATDNLSVVIDDADGELASSLSRPPADAAGQWADTLRRLSQDCAGSEVEHALPSMRVVLRTPSECKAGAKKNELTFDFVPRETGSAVDARGRVVSQGKVLGVEARVLPSTDPKALCAVGRVDLGAPAAEAPRKAPAPGTPERWLAVPFQLVGGLVGLLPIKR